MGRGRRGGRAWAALVPLVWGCATGATPGGMAPSGPPEPARLDAAALERAPTLSIRTTGGEETNPLHTSEIGNDAFTAAVAWEVVRRGAFRPVFDHPADYHLHVHLVEVRQPFWGWLDMEVAVVADWHLRDLRTGGLVFAERIRSRFEATGEDSSVGIRRLRLANEGSARRNIEAGVRGLVAALRAGP